MYIHSYQIHNVLNVYRKQLSQGSMRKGAADGTQSSPEKDQVRIPIEGQRQSLVDRISAEIVERLTQFGHETKAEALLTEQMAGRGTDLSPTSTQWEGGAQKESAFTYTFIDENNRKVTNTLPVRPYGLSTQGAESVVTAKQDGDMITN